MQTKISRIRTVNSEALRAALHALETCSKFAFRNRAQLKTGVVFKATAFVSQFKKQGRVFSGVKDLITRYLSFSIINQPSKRCSLEYQVAITTSTSTRVNLLRQKSKSRCAKTERQQLQNYGNKLQTNKQQTTESPLTLPMHFLVFRPPLFFFRPFPAKGSWPVGRRG